MDKEREPVETPDRRQGDAGFPCLPGPRDRGDGKGERNTVYIGRYHCHTSNWKSQSGGKPKADITRSAARSGIHGLGGTIWQSDIQIRMTIWMLYLVEFADWNSQKTIGKGCGDNSAPGNMGYTDSMPYHTGTTQNSRDSYGLGTQYRNIEGLWDNVYDWGDGCYYNSAGLNIIMNPNQFSDTSGGTAVGVPVGGWPAHLRWQRKAVWSGASTPRRRGAARPPTRRITGTSARPTRVCASAVTMARTGTTGFSV